MDASAKQLRPYQVRLVTDVCRATEDILVEQPTGAGKTVQIVTLIAMQLGRRFSHALICAPQQHIEQAFVKRDYQVIAFPDCHGVAVPSIQAPNQGHKNLIKGARESGLGSVKRVIHYLRQQGPQDHAFACTHAALNHLSPADLPDDLSGKALFIDEAHHASADGLSEIVNLWRERGGQLFFFTATPYRGDGRPVRLEGMRTFRRSLAEHMAEGFAPRHLESEIVALGQPGDVITAAQFTGEAAPPNSYLDGLVAAIVRRWREDGQSKAIVRVPPMHGGRSGDLVGRLLQSLAAQGARALDATGTGAQDKQRFLAALDAEKTRNHSTSAFDVMVGIQRVLEGTDWPVCSAVYCVGMPGSLNTVVQFLGRAMRLKGDDYPATHRDRARLVFFVPCGGGSALADLSIDHSRHALLTCCFLADHEVGQEWIVTQEVRRGIEAALGPRADNPAAVDAENDADEPLDPEIRAEVELAMADAREQIICNGYEPTVGEVVQLTGKTRPDLPEAAIQRVATEILAAADNPAGRAARKAIQREIATRLRIDPKVKQAMTAAFAVVLDEFRTVTLKDSAVLETVGRQVHGVSGGQMGEFAQRLREAAPKPLTEEQILTWADKHQERTAKWPTSESGPVHEAPDETWANINTLLVNGLRGLPGGSSVAKLLKVHRGKRNQKDLPRLSIEIILLWADGHHQFFGEWPKPNSGLVREAPGETWNAINTALVDGIRGLSGGSSLPKLLATHRDVRNKADLPPLSIDEILAWADGHYERTGQWPGQDSGPIHATTDITWKSVGLALYKGGRGLPGGSSLANLLAEYRGVRNRLAPPSLSICQILEWIDAHHQDTGTWPNRGCGPVNGVPGESWAGIDAALKRGIRGLSRGSSLAKLLGKHRGVRNHKDLAPLTVDEILEWADAHYERTGEWPGQDSGLIHGRTDITWRSIHLALYRGGRGLLGGSSLATLLAEHRGVRNRMDLSSLTVGQILAWADEHHQRTGKWPKVKFGAVDGLSGETWRGIEYALRVGTRGLPGGSTLARLIHKHRGNSSSLGQLNVVRQPTSPSTCRRDSGADS